MWQIWKYTEASVSSETDWGSNLDPDAKRKRVRDIGSSIVHGASSLARALKRCEEKKEKRHRELMELEEQRIRLDEAQNEAQREGVASLVAAVNNLSGAIQSLASDQRPASWWSSSPTYWLTWSQLKLWIKRINLWFTI